MLERLKVLILDVNFSNRYHKYIIRALIDHQPKIVLKVPYATLNSYCKRLNKFKGIHDIIVTTIYSDDISDDTSSDDSDGKGNELLKIHENNENIFGRKRSSPDMYETPECVRTRVHGYKKMLKISAINSGLTAPRTLNISNNEINKLPAGLSFFLSKMTSGHYEKLRDNFGSNHIRLSASPSANMEEVNDIVKDHATRLLNSILLGEDYWVFITHIDAFYQNHRMFDDCALPNNDDIKLEPKVILNEKNELRNSWKELIIQWGPIQFLCVGGFFGSNMDSKVTPFLGSAISSKSKLQNDTFTIWTPLFPSAYQCSPRFLRDYSRKHASLPWSFASIDYPFSNITPCHPLYYDNHFSRVNSKPNITSICSLILKCICLSEITNQDLQIIKNTLFQIHAFSNHIENLQQANSNIFNAVLELISTNQSKLQLFIKPITILAKWESQINESIENTITIIIDNNLKSMALDLYKNHVYRPMVAINRKLIDGFNMSD